MIRSEDLNKGYGRLVEIAHPDGRRTLYAHLNERLCSRGDWVHQNRPIGKVGKSGNARAKAIKPHLHFEVLENGYPVDPMKGYLKLDGSVITDQQS